MSNNDEIQALKLYHISSKDIDEKGNINPDAKLIPLYYENYHIDPATVTEKLSDHDMSTASDIHDGRMFDLDYFTANGVKPYRHRPIKTRGQSVLGYASKDNAKDTLSNSWRMHSPYSNGTVHVKNKNNGKEYDEHVQCVKLFDNLKDAAMSERLQPFDSNAETIENWDKRGLNDFYKMSLNKNLDLGPIIPYDSNERFVKVPVIITANKGDLVTLDDMLTKGYDPGRDFLWDKQLKAYKTKQLPSGIFMPATLNEELMKYTEELEAEFGENTSEYNLEDLVDYLNRTFDTFRQLVQYDSLKTDGLNDTDAAVVDKAWDSMTDNLIKYNADLTNNSVVDSINNYLDRLYDFYKGVVQDINILSLHSDVKHMTIRYPDLKDIFDYDNPLTLSDAQYKQVFMDLSNDRKHKNICAGLYRKY